MTWTAAITQADHDVLHAHLFRPDHDEHAAFLFAGSMSTASGPRMIVRRVVPVRDEDFGPSDQGAYRQVSSRAVTRAAIECDDQGLCLMWAHSHPGSGDRAGFSDDDRRSHARAHPHLIEITHGRPVGSLVLGESSIAGELWTEQAPPQDLVSLRVVGPHLQTIRPAPLRDTAAVADRFARQVLLFGKDGQDVLRSMTVGVAGAGGGGSLIVQSLAHLGVGRIVVVDFDHVSTSNLSRIVGSTPRDAARRRLKVHVLRDLVRHIDSSINFEAVIGDITYAEDARRLAEVDFLFSATDTFFARYAFNALVHQYLIPGIQVGTKVHANPETGEVDLVFAAERPLTLEAPCLECAGLIPAEALQREQLSSDERRAQQYVGARPGVDAEALEDPSVITLNAISTALATTDFMFMAIGLLREDVGTGQRIFYPQERNLRTRGASPLQGCRWCDHTAPLGSFARGDLWDLPLRPGRFPGHRSSPSLLQRAMHLISRSAT
jgi:hypothetical protein